MFELERLRGSRDEGIALQTRRRRDIRNSLGVDLTEIHLRRYEVLVGRYGQSWLQRRPPSGAYNCAGHLWASRRTCIYEEADWRMILTDDGYQIVSEPIPDDLIIYLDREQGILHIGRVVELKEGVTGESRRIPWIVSKWSDISGEVYHYEHDHPFRGFGFVVLTEYWTDRPTA